jgi:hypothetical protein
MANQNHRGMNWLTSVGFVALGAGYLWEFARGSKTGNPVGPPDLDGLKKRRRMLGAAPEGAPLVVQDGIRSIKFYPAGNIDNRLKFIIDQIRKDSMDKKTVTEARAIVSGKCKVERGGVNWCVTPKDWEGELRMLFWAVTNPNSPYAMRYTRDHATIDMFGSSDSHRRLPSGDCFVHGTLVLREDGSVAAVETLKVGDRIWGYDKWTTVIQTWDKGILPTWKITLSNGRTMRLTPDHKVWVRRTDGELDVIRVAELTTDTELIQPERVETKIERSMAPNGDLFVKHIETDDLALPCFDFATEDKFIWLPEADWTVHNCDDFSIRLGALARAIGYAVKCRIVAPAGQPNQWAHIYLMVGDEAGNPNPRRWLPMDPTEPQHGPFWEVSKRMISTVKDYDV